MWLERAVLWAAGAPASANERTKVVIVIGTSCGCDVQLAFVRKRVQGIPDKFAAKSGFEGIWWAIINARLRFPLWQRRSRPAESWAFGRRTTAHWLPGTCRRIACNRTPPTCLASAP